MRQPVPTSLSSEAQQLLSITHRPGPPSLLMCFFMWPLLLRWSRYWPRPLSGILHLWQGTVTHLGGAQCHCRTKETPSVKTSSTIPFPLRPPARPPEASPPRCRCMARRGPRRHSRQRTRFLLPSASTESSSGAPCGPGLFGLNRQGLLGLLCIHIAKHSSVPTCLLHESLTV